MEYNFGKTDNYFNILGKEYTKNGEILWKDFNDDQTKNKNKVVLVSQKDFEYGTMRVRVPCMIKLVENISFNPNRPKTWLDSNGKVTENVNNAVSIDPNRKLDWWPDFSLEQNKVYFKGDVRNAYRLGFFAAVTLESNDIIVNLNNKIIMQHPEHALQQRFFSVIELADQPFVPKQGPANFGTSIKTASNVAIINGKIGLSSHHGIHGNGVNTILIKNVDFVDNEVCSIALNGSNDSYIVNVNVIKNRHDIPVLGSYSGGRFLKLFINGLEDAIKVNSETFDSSLKELNRELDETFDAVILNNGTVPDIYINKSGLIDGNYYGIIINPMGVAVNAPLENRNSVKANESNSLYMKCVSINDIKTNINEILPLNRNGKNMTAPSGSIFQFRQSYKIVEEPNQPSKYYYNGNTLSDIQIELVDILQKNPHIKKFLGNFSLDEGLLIWKKDKQSYFVHDYDKFVGKNGLDGYDYNIIGNGDSMFHVNKGSFGLRIDGLNTGVIDNLTITNVISLGKEGSDMAGNYRKSHPTQKHLNGYHGHHTYGVHLNASNDLMLENVTLKNIKSTHGSCHGVNVSGESVKISLKDSICEGIECSQTPFDETKKTFPNLPTNARGIFVNTQCGVNLKNISLRNIKDNPNCLNPSDCEFLSIITQN